MCFPIAANTFSFFSWSVQYLIQLPATRGWTENHFLQTTSSQLSAIRGLLWLHAQPHCALISCMPHSLTCPLLPWICMLRKNKYANKSTYIYVYHQRRFKTQLFSFYFLFVSCRLFLKKEAPRSANYHFSWFVLLFFPRKHAYHFHCPFMHPSILPSLPHYPIIVLSLVWEREEDRREEKEEKKEERKMASFLLVCLSVCLSHFCPGMASWKVATLSPSPIDNNM